jgi:acetolactate synthase-1/2/3 large subunit
MTTVGERPTGTTADRLLEALARRGTRRIFGLPGGGSSLDVIAAAPRHGIEFVLCRHEAAAAVMALADAELTGAPGAALTTKGPGVANAANGLLCATLERAPVILISDGFTQRQLSYITHQVNDQRMMTSALVKGYARADGADAAREIEALLDLAEAAPRGAVHLDLTGEAARRPAERWPEAARRPVAAADPDSASIAAARALLARARRPVLLVGLEATDAGEPEAVRRLAERLGCPVLVTYKAKGVLGDDHPLQGGIFTGGTLEAPCVDKADLLVLVGLDPVELILQPWRYATPVLDVGLRPHPVHYTQPAAGLYGPLANSLDALIDAARPGAWTLSEIADHRAACRAALAWNGQDGVAPPRIVEVLQHAGRAAGRHPRVSVDAGAHMFSATAFWACEAPRDLLISNGLASMAFALPAGIAAALHDRTRGAVAFTGDGGLMMCAGELATAAELGVPLVVVVFNDGALSLIDIKRQQRQLPGDGARWSTRPDFAKVAEGFGVRGFRAHDEASYRIAVEAALAEPGPSLIDVMVDPAGYPDQLQAMRG